MDRKLTSVLRDIATRYPRELIGEQLKDIPRIAFNITTAVTAAKPKSIDQLEICDLGGGIGLFSVGCAAFGMKRSVLVDDFDDAVNHKFGYSILDIHKSHGVEIIKCNVIENGLEDIPGTFDIITSFDSMEHWHNSPKNLFHNLVKKLNPGGIFLLGVPNCVNIRKRISIPFGIGKWSGMKEWYESEKFRGHVREPDVDDLKYIAQDIELTNAKIIGRNWAGYYSANPIVQLATKVMDLPLRMNPRLCSDIYLVGTQPRTAI